MDHFLLFRVDGAVYALGVSQIQEIVESPSLHYIPRAPASFLGAINVHGNVLPVLDLVTHLGYPAELRDHRVIVLAPELCRLALSVSAISRIVPGYPDNFLPHLERHGQDSFSRAQFEYEVEHVDLLDVSRLMASLTPL